MKTEESPIVTSEDEKWSLELLATSNVYFPHIADILHRSVDDVIRLLALLELSNDALREWIEARRAKGESKAEILDGLSFWARSHVETILVELEYDDTHKSAH